MHGNVARSLLLLLTFVCCWCCRVVARISAAAAAIVAVARAVVGGLDRCSFLLEWACVGVHQRCIIR